MCFYWTLQHSCSRITFQSTTSMKKNPPILNHYTLETSELMSQWRVTFILGLYRFKILAVLQAILTPNIRQHRSQTTSLHYNEHLWQQDVYNNRLTDFTCVVDRISINSQQRHQTDKNLYSTAIPRISDNNTIIKKNHDENSA